MNLYSVRSINFFLVTLNTFINFKPTYSLNKALTQTLNEDNFTNITKTAQITTKILRVCYQDDLDKIVLAGDWTDIQSWNRYFPTSMSFKICGMSQRKVYKQFWRASGFYKINEAVVRKLYYPAKIFIISTRDHHFLREILTLLKKSVVWDSRALFIVIEKFCSNACSNVTLAIETLWRFNILNIVYLCNGSEGNINFYNFNPFSTHAVRPWTLEDQIMDKDRNHPISIFHFSTPVENFGSSLCGSLNFEKAKTLDNYPINMSGALSKSQFRKIAVLKKPMFLDDFEGIHTEMLLDEFEGIDARINKIIWTKLDVNPRIYIYPKGYIGSDHKPYGSIKEVTDGKYDMGVNQYFSRSFWRLQTYPHLTTGIKAVSLEEKRNVDSSLIISEPVILVYTVLISLLIMLSMRYLLKFEISQAFEANFKLLLGIPITYMGSGWKKLFFVFLALFTYFLSTFLQSSLSSSLVLPTNSFSIDSYDDLLTAIKLEYKIYGPNFVTEFVSENITRAFDSEDFFECTEKLHIRLKSVCISDIFATKYIAKGNITGIHVSKNKIAYWYYVFIVREDWPLKARFDFLIAQLKEAGIIYHFAQDVISARFKGQNALKEHAPFRPLSLKTVESTMFVLLTGLFIAFCVFLAEHVRMIYYRRMGTNRYKLNNLNIFKQSRSLS